ncbi:class E sortase [Actinomyces provencensis]|uniref:class E sortase n=1 Tax=Actinomyces provencensis TaxID=1720198 RepID=UPI00096A950B
MAEHVRAGARNAGGRRRGGGLLVGLMGVIGELLITAAVVLALFAVWQLYWTTWKVEGPRAQQVAQFEQEHAAAEGLGERHTDDPPAVQPPADGAVYGVLHVPSWDWMKMPLAQGTTNAVLDLGYAGHYEETAQPGEIGNFSVAGHRRTYGNNFRHIDRLAQGDKVVVEVADTYYVYRVETHEIVSPDAVRVVAPVPGDKTFSEQPTQRWMTMTTCHPEYSNTERYIVHLLFESWTPKSTGVPQELLDEPTD